MSGCIRDIEVRNGIHPGVYKELYSFSVIIFQLFQMFKNTITHKREKFDELKAKRREIVNDIGEFTFQLVIL